MSPLISESHVLCTIHAKSVNANKSTLEINGEVLFQKLKPSQPLGQ